MPEIPHVLAGMKLYGLDLSYYTGKVEAFLRYREIAHERIELSLGTLRLLESKTGLAQMPAIELADGRWLSDSTPMIEWLDAAAPGPRVLPECPVQRFFSRLVEDYADEWLWRPALHYRWSHPHDAYLMSHRIASELMRDLPLPHFLRRQFIRQRQYHRFVRGDGVTRATRAHVESVYLRNLEFLQCVLAARPYLLGERPTLADFGYFASMFRHFALDPTPARLMRDRAPAVLEWVARLWNARASRVAGPLHPAGEIPPEWQPILEDIGRCYLPYLNANAAAYAAGHSRFVLELEGTRYRLPVHRYRVHCLERLQRAFNELPSPHAEPVRAQLESAGCWSELFRIADPHSGFDPEERAPFFVPGMVWAQDAAGGR